MPELLSCQDDPFHEEVCQEGHRANRQEEGLRVTQGLVGPATGQVRSFFFQKESHIPSLDTLALKGRTLIHYETEKKTGLLVSVCY